MEHTKSDHAYRGICKVCKVCKVTYSFSVIARNFTYGFYRDVKFISHNINLLWTTLHTLHGLYLVCLDRAPGGIVVGEFENGFNS